MASKKTPLPILNEQLRQLSLWMANNGAIQTPHTDKVIARIAALKAEIVARQMV